MKTCCADFAGLVTGIVFLIGGVVLFIVAMYAWPVIFYSIFCLAIGIAILVNLKKSNEIEQIHDVRNFDYVKKRKGGKK